MSELTGRDANVSGVYVERFDCQQNYDRYETFLRLLMNLNSITELRDTAG